MALPSCPGLKSNRRVKERETLQLAHCENVRTRSRYDLPGGPGGRRPGRQRMRHSLRHSKRFRLQAEKIGGRRKTKSHQKRLVAGRWMNIEEWSAGGMNFRTASLSLFWWIKWIEPCRRHFVSHNNQSVSDYRKRNIIKFNTFNELTKKSWRVNRWQI